MTHANHFLSSSSWQHESGGHLKTDETFNLENVGLFHNPRTQASEDDTLSMQDGADSCLKHGVFVG